MISPGVASFTVTLPTMFLLVDWATITATSGQLLVCYCLNGVFFHCQTIAAYYLMDYISPVTHSVANTGKVSLNENPKILELLMKFLEIIKIDSINMLKKV